MEQIQRVLTAWKNKFCRDLLLCQTRGKKVPNLKCLNCIESYHGSVISTLPRDPPAHWGCLSSSDTQQIQETPQQQKPKLSSQVQSVPGLKKKPAVGKNRNALPPVRTEHLRMQQMLLEHSLPTSKISALIQKNK